MKTLFETVASRRTFMKSSAAVLGAAMMPLGGARAQSKGRIIVGTWGGDFSKYLTKHVESRLSNEGWTVVQDQAGNAERRAKLLAERQLPQGATDVQGFLDLQMYQMFELGATEEIDYSRIPNAAKLLPSMRPPYGVPQIFSGFVIFHGPNVSAPPTSFKELFDPDTASRLALEDQQYQYNMIAATLAAGGAADNLEPGMELLLELRKGGTLIYSSNEALARGLDAGEFDFGLMGRARTVYWQNAGINMSSVVPSEGALPFASGFVVPKNAPNKDGAYAYLNALLEKSAQEGFAADMGYNPTIADAAVPPELAERIIFKPEEVERLVRIDFAFITEHDAAMKEWWDKAFKG